MAKLTVDVITFVVTRLACFERPTEVQRQVKESFRLDMSLPQIMYYDPTTSGTGVGKRWKKLFSVTREKFIRTTSNIPIAHRSVRLQRLQRLADKAEDMKNIDMASRMLEQAAKEVGDAYTNRRVMVPGDAGALADELSKMLGVDRDEILAASGA